MHSSQNRLRSDWERVCALHTEGFLPSHAFITLRAQPKPLCYAGYSKGFPPKNCFETRNAFLEKKVMEITARVLNTFDQRFTLDHLMLVLDKARVVGKLKSG